MKKSHASPDLWTYFIGKTTWRSYTQHLVRGDDSYISVCGKEVWSIADVDAIMFRDARHDERTCKSCLRSVYARTLNKTAR